MRRTVQSAKMKKATHSIKTGPDADFAVRKHACVDEVVDNRGMHLDAGDGRADNGAGGSGNDKLDNASRLTQNIRNVGMSATNQTANA